MKILCITVSNKGIKIPFTNYQVPIPIFVAGFISIFGTRTAASNNTDPVGNYLISNAAVQLDGGDTFHYQTSDNQNILPKFPDIVANVLHDLFPPRFSFKTARIFSILPPLLKEAINVGIKDHLTERGLGENPAYESSIECFNSRMNKLSKEFSEEYQAMKTAVEMAQHYEQCKENSESDHLSELTDVCFLEAVVMGGSVFKHREKSADLTTKLQTASKDCDKQINSKHEEMMNRKKDGKLS